MCITLKISCLANFEYNKIILVYQKYNRKVFLLGT